MINPTSFPPKVIPPKMPLSISKVKWPTIRIRISCFPISRCHIFVKARPMAESRPRLQHPWINRRCGCDKRISLGFEKSHAPCRIISSIVIMSISDSDLHENTPDEKFPESFRAPFDKGARLSFYCRSWCVVSWNISETSYKSTSFSSVCLVFLISIDFWNYECVKVWFSIFHLSYAPFFQVVQPIPLWQPPFGPSKKEAVRWRLGRSTNSAINLCSSNMGKIRNCSTLKFQWPSSLEKFLWDFNLEISRIWLSKSALNVELLASGHWNDLS